MWQHPSKTKGSAIQNIYNGSSNALLGTHHFFSFHSTIAQQFHKFAALTVVTTVTLAKCSIRQMPVLSNISHDSTQLHTCTTPLNSTTMKIRLTPQQRLHSLFDPLQVKQPHQTSTIGSLSLTAWQIHATLFIQARGSLQPPWFM